MTAIGQWTVLANAYPAEPKYRAELVRSYISQSNLDFTLDRFGPARAACEQSLVIRKKLVADDPKNETFTRDLGTAWDNLANIRAVAREWTESKSARQQAADLFRKLVAASPFRSLYRNDLARTQFNLGTTLLNLGEPAPAADALAKPRTNGIDSIRRIPPSASMPSAWETAVRACPRPNGELVNLRRPTRRWQKPTRCAPTWPTNSQACRNMRSS